MEKQKLYNITLGEIELAIVMNILTCGIQNLVRTMSFPECGHVYDKFRFATPIDEKPEVASSSNEVAV